MPIKFFFITLAGILAFSGCGTTKSETNTNQTAEIFDGRTEEYQQEIMITITDVSTAEDRRSDTVVAQGTVPIINWNIDNKSSVTNRSINSFDLNIGSAEGATDIWDVRQVSGDLRSMGYGQAPSGAIQLQQEQELAAGTYFININAVDESGELVGRGQGFFTVR